LAITETRLLSLASILDQYGDLLTNKEIDKLEEELKSVSVGGANSNFAMTLPPADGLDPGTGNYNNNTFPGAARLQGYLKVVRVEWTSMKKVGTYVSINQENGEKEEQLVDETFTLDFDEIEELKAQGIETPLEWFWINEGWEGVKIGRDTFVGIQPKVNQRRRMDNPYYCRLGYSGLIYNATNSVSVSLIDRMRPYQYLYNIISYRLELAFASDMGKIMLMDLAQIPRSEGINLEQWMYYLKAMKIAFINSHEESGKGNRTGMISNFNQFQSIDLTLANTIQQYISTLEFIKNQIGFLSGISPQRLGAISSNELVGNVQRSVEQSSNITEYWFDSHNEVKRRVYTALIECAKIAWREGKKVQFVLDDMSIEMLNVDGAQFENAEYDVFVSNSSKDTQTHETLKQLFQVGLQSDKVNMSEIAKVLSTDSIQDLTRMLEDADEKRAQQSQEQGKQQQQIHQEQLADKQQDRELKRYEIDSNNQTKIETATISALGFAKDADSNDNGIPDVMEQSKLALEENKHLSKLNEDNRNQQFKDKELDKKHQLETEKIKANEKNDRERQAHELKLKKMDI